MATKILITGVSGFVGSHLITKLKNNAHQLVCINRKLLQIDGVTCYQIEDINQTINIENCLHNIQTVIHCAARVHVMNETNTNPLQAFREVNVEGTMQLARQAAQAGVMQFIYLSSVKVNGEFTPINKKFNEENPASPQDAYGISKYEAELALLELGKQTGMAITIIRPPLVYGNGVGANFLSMLKWVKKRIPLPLGSIHNQRSLVYVENLVDFISCCVQNQAAYNEVFLISDDHDVSTSELLRLCASALNVKSALFPFPSRLIVLAASLFGKKSISDRLCLSLALDISKAKNLLNWSPPFSMAEGLAASASALTNEKTILNINQQSTTNKK